MVNRRRHAAKHRALGAARGAERKTPQDRLALQRREVDHWWIIGESLANPAETRL
ncbi:hypothetical protein [Paenibacillus sp. GM2]|uniref:hypothetical protein n=1 Tax=Paenibacillus sp. GM2 TaxID=1622070 RepID=UPI00189FF113|nr:hypothetical protein [Paenibacillus sp. GM2]